MSNPSVISASGVLFVDLQDGSSARAPISDNDPLRAAYACFVSGLTPAANPTDVVTIQGSASKIIRLRSLTFTGTATAASNIIINTVRRSSANTGGTFTTRFLVPRDQNDDPATAVVSVYTANPASLGNQIGGASAITDGGRLNIAPAANGAIDRMALQYSWYNDKAPILRGVNDFLCVNLGGAAWPSGGLLDVNIVLTEDTQTRI